MTREADNPSITGPELFGNEGEKLRHKCGIGGIYVFDPDQYDVTTASLSLLYSLRNRGQEGAGGYFTDGSSSILHRRSGDVPHVFHEELVNEIMQLKPRISVIQNRYSTSGLEHGAWQPIPLGSEEEEIGVLSHNGNLTNAKGLYGELPQDMQSLAESDSWVAAKLMGLTPGPMSVKIATIAQRMEGAYSLVLADKKNLYALRDPWGIRPLSIGLLPNGAGFVVASETAAFEPLHATFVRDVREGEGVVINQDGIQPFFADKRTDITKLAHCIFEIIYFGWPDSVIWGKHVMEIRMALGAMHALQDLNEGFIPDVICGVDKSGRSYSHGYARAMRRELATNPEKYGVTREQLPIYMEQLGNVEALVRNEYMSRRAFIAPDGREAINEIKHRADPFIVDGKRVVVLDDSIVRNKTIWVLNDKLRRAGAREVHNRIMSPPVIDRCYLGIDIARREELVANRLGGDLEKIRQAVGADSLRYTSHAMLLSAVTGSEVQDDGPEIYSDHGYCGGCFTGVHPEGINPQGVLGKVNK